MIRQVENLVNPLAIQLCEFFVDSSTQKRRICILRGQRQNQVSLPVFNNEIRGNSFRKASNFSLPSHMPMPLRFSIANAVVRKNFAKAGKLLEFFNQSVVCSANTYIAIKGRGFAAFVLHTPDATLAVNNSSKPIFPMQGKIERFSDCRSKGSIESMLLTRRAGFDVEPFQCLENRDSTNIKQLTDSFCGKMFLVVMNCKPFTMIQKWMSDFKEMGLDVFSHFHNANYTQHGIKGQVL